jgi:hypothetical protein
MIMYVYIILYITYATLFCLELGRIKNIAFKSHPTNLIKRSHVAL